MSTGYLYDEDDWDWEEYDYREDYEADESDEWECAFPGRCLMAGEHLRSECHTAEMYEEHVKGISNV